MTASAVTCSRAGCRYSQFKTMRGYIGNKEALMHLGLIWREFGPRCAARCLGSVLRGKRGTGTFLEAAFPRAKERRRACARPARSVCGCRSAGTRGPNAP